MQNRSFSPTPWIKVGLAILPGLSIVGTRSGFFRRVFGLENWLALGQNDLIPVYIALGIVIAGLILERRIAAWSLPALGLLLFSAPGWLFTLLARFGNPRSPFWQVAPLYLMLAALAAIAALAAYRVFKQHGLHIPRSGWLLLGLMVLVSTASVIVGAITDRNPNKWVSLLAHLPLVLWWTGLILLPVAIGLPLARRDGLLAGLLVVGAEFVLVDEIFDPAYALGMWMSNQVIVRIVDAIPAVGLLVVVPLWMMRSHSTRGRIWGLLLPTFVALVGAEIIAGSVRPYYADIWPTRAIGITQFLAVLALAVVMYHWIEHQSPAAADTQKGKGASKGKTTTATAINAA